MFLFTLMCNSVNGQEYTKIIEPNSTVWHFAHKQLAGEFIDTIFAGDQTDGWTNLWYHGVFKNNVKTYMGKVKASFNNDSVWYIPPDETHEKLLFDLTLNKGDTFKLTGFIVDTVFYEDGRKYVEFTEDTHWDENIRFIEGVGPNLSFIYGWLDLGISHPYVVCQFLNGQKIYSANNSHFKDCRLLTDNSRLKKSGQFKVYPVPFNEILNVSFPKQGYTQFYIFDQLGKMVLRKNYFKNEVTINTESLGKGIYILKIITENQCETYKLTKQ